MPVEMPDISLISDSESIYAPVQRAQAYKQQQNALARQQAVRNALAANIDPATGRTNWQNAYAMGGQDVAPELQAAQQADIGRISKEDADYLTNMRNQLDMYVNDQPSYDAWVSQVKTHHPYANFPEKFSPEVKDQLSGYSRKLELAGRGSSDEYKILTADEASALGLPSGQSYQQRSNGQVVRIPSPPVSAGGGVDMTKFSALNDAIARKLVPISKINGRTAALLNQLFIDHPDTNLADMNLEQIRDASGARVGGANQQNIEQAGNEALGMIAVARAAAERANLANLKPMNGFMKWLGGQTTNPQFAALNVAINSVINTYARAINPKGIATVSAQNHARELIDSAMSKGNLFAAFDMMEKEIDRAHIAAQTGPGSKNRNPASKPPAIPAAPSKDGDNWEDL